MKANPSCRSCWGEGTVIHWGETRRCGWPCRVDCHCLQPEVFRIVRTEDMARELAKGREGRR